MAETVSNRKSSLRDTWTVYQTVFTDHSDDSPMLRLKPPWVPEKLVPDIGDDDLKKLLKTVARSDFESRRDKAILSLFIDVRMRVSEMAGIDVATSTSTSTRGTSWFTGRADETVSCAW